MARFTNQAQLTYNTMTANSNVAVGEITEMLAVTKTAVTPSYSDENKRVTYVVSIINSGMIADNGLSVTDNLGGYAFDEETVYPLQYIDGSVLYYLNGVLQTETPTVVPGPPFQITGVNIPAGGNVTIVYEAETTDYAPKTFNAQITNQVTVSGAGVAPVTAEETITTENRPQLSITKSINPVPVSEGGTLTYTFLIQNTGNQPATADDNLILTDELNPILDNLRVTYNGMDWVEGNQYTYTAGLFRTTEGAMTVPAATFEQDPDTGEWITIPGMRTLTITGDL